jgi:hypothetical protein
METAQQPIPQASLTPGDQPSSSQATTVINIQKKSLTPTQLGIIFLVLLLPIIGLGGYFLGQKSPLPSSPITSIETPAPSPLVSPGMDGTLTDNIFPLVAVSYTGGLCVTGTNCESSMQIMPNGNVMSKGELVHKISAAETAALLSSITSVDFSQLREKPFTGTCPIAYDGQEKIYKFYVAGREEVLPSCTYDIESLPLIKLERISKPLESFGMIDVYVHPVRTAMAPARSIASQTEV